MDSNGQNRSLKKLRFPPVAYALAGNVLLYASLPPVGWSWLAWIAPACWLPLIESHEFSTHSQKPPRSRRVYRTVFCTHMLFWLLLLQGMRLAHWTTNFGWIALAGYLGLYLPLFIFTARTICHQLRLPLTYSAAIAWVCVEWVRGYVLSGFSIGSLSHSQVHQLWVLQIADLGGGFAVSFLLVLGGGSLYRLTQKWLSHGQQDVPWRPVLLEVVIFTVLVTGTFLYGQSQISKLTEPSTGPLVSVGLIQGDTYTEFDLSREEYMAKEQKKQKTYNDQTIRALGSETELDLLVWPESMYPIGPLLATGDNSQTLYVPAQPLEVSEDQVWVKQWADNLKRGQELQHAEILGYLYGNQDESGLGKPLMLGGTSSVDLTLPHTPSYNSAALISPKGEVLDVYHKNHLVMFGEYIPLGEVFPSLYNFLPISALAPGKRDITFEIDGVKFSPNICFESTVPHRVRKMIAGVGEDQRRPDVMVNLTNDGWFWGSSILDLHLRSNIMRSVELRRPNLIAANTGISAWISATGKLNSFVEKKQAGFVIAKVGRAVEDSFYLLNGDLFAILCGAITLISMGKLIRNRSVVEASNSEKSYT